MNSNSRNLRTAISILLSLVIIAIGYFLSQRIAATREKPKTSVNKTITKVYTDTVHNENIPIEIKETGSLQALRQVELFSEVQGILLSGNKLFKPGQTYSKGSTIFSIDDSEYAATLVAQKASLYNIITQVLPDLRLDYSDVFQKWNNYLTSFDIQKEVPTLPEFESEKEKYFINSKNIVTTYYNIKNMEERHKKYRIYAPFYCTVTEALVYPGALIRPGQKLGTIISPNLYEMVVSVDASYTSLVKPGMKVALRNLDKSQSWTGRIARVDAVVNTTSQGINFYVEVSGEGLKSGMFLEALIEGKSIENSFEIPRKLLVDNQYIYIVQSDSLALTPVDVAFYKERTAVVTNLPENTITLKNNLPGAYQGMLVEVISE